VRRFWDEVTIESGPEGHAILLDRKPMRIPGGAPLAVQSRALAVAIAAEWREAGGAKGGEMDFGDVPLTRLAGTAQERIAPDPAPTVDALAKYAETDLLCYRAEAPEALVHRQARAWQPWLDWAALALDAPLKVTHGVMHVRQDPQALHALRAAVAAQPAPVLAGLGIAVPALGSLVLGLALAAGRLDAAEAHALSVLDETFQEEFWGADPEAVARRAGIAAEIALAARFMALARAGIVRG
jgi:chaperone required for assembly of F1-ATPase